MNYFSMLFFPLFFLIVAGNEAQIIIDGELTEAEYQLVSTRLNANGGFAPDCELTNVYCAVLNGNLFLGVECKLQSVPNYYNPLPDGLGIWLNVSSVEGLPPGNPLGIFNFSDYHYLNGSLEVGGPSYILEYKADFEVDYMFAVYTDGSTEHIILDAASHAGSTQNMLQSIGMSDQSGTPISGPSATGIFSSNSIEFAFQQSGFEGSLKGFEVRIPLSELSATPDDTFELFTPIVSSTAYFSDQTIPGNVLSSNSGFAPDYFANVNSLSCDCPSPGGTIGEGPYHSASVVLPVELISFTASSNGKEMILNWTTATEINNHGFEVQRSMDSSDFVTIGFIKGSGTTVDQQSYSFIDDNLVDGIYSYRLMQIDFNGSFRYSKVVEFEFSNYSTFMLIQNYPNPFNPSTKISWNVPMGSWQTLKIYDALGNEVATLVDEYKPAGSYEIEWNASGLPSGVYFYQLKSGSFIETKKMNLMK